MVGSSDELHPPKTPEFKESIGCSTCIEAVTIVTHFANHLFLFVIKFHNSYCADFKPFPNPSLKITHEETFTH